jgi:thiol:disulfide interchange protein
LRFSRMIGFSISFLWLTALVAGADKISWTSDMNSALAAAKKENKPLMIDFMADWCEPCKEMEQSTFNNASVILKAKSFISVRIDIDKQREVAEKYKALPRAYGGIGVPNMLFLTTNGVKIKHIVGYQGPKQLVAVMDAVLKY